MPVVFKAPCTHVHPQTHTLVWISWQLLPQLLTIILPLEMELGNEKLIKNAYFFLFSFVSLLAYVFFLFVYLFVCLFLVLC